MLSEPVLLNSASDNAGPDDEDLPRKLNCPFLHMSNWDCERIMVIQEHFLQ